MPYGSSVLDSHWFFFLFLLVIGTYSVASGTTYEAEKGTLGGSAVLFSDSSFSGGGAVGYLGTSRTFDFIPYQPQPVRIRPTDDNTTPLLSYMTHIVSSPLFLLYFRF